MSRLHAPECGQLVYGMLTSGTDRWELCRWDLASRLGPGHSTGEAIPVQVAAGGQYPSA